MQTKLKEMSKKEKKLINLVSAIKSRGYNVEGIYEQIALEEDDSHTIERFELLN